MSEISHWLRLRHVIVGLGVFAAGCSGQSNPGTFQSNGGAGAGGAVAVTNRNCQGVSTQCQGESCCTYITVPAGTFKMGRSEQATGGDYYPSGAGDELPEHDTTLTAFGLDKYEVTVGRFRKFVEDYDNWHVTAGNPLPNAGAHPTAPNTGWGQTWPAGGDQLPADSAALKVDLNCGSDQTWTDTVGGNEAAPINCANWYLAFAFCIWDNGRLPTEAEWEYAAAGGTDNRLFPWGAASPDATTADFAGSDDSPLIPVGSKGALGAARWGHQDLAGSMWELLFDQYSATYYGTSGAPTPCDNCANVIGDNTGCSLRGGAWNTSRVGDLRAAERDSAPRSGVVPSFGFRCGRAAQ